MKHIISALGILLIGFQLGAQTTFTASTTKDKNGYTFQSVSNDPLKTRIYTLSNGLKVYLSRYTDAPRIQTYIAVRAGSKNDPANTTGLAHYLEHILFKGTSKIGTSNWGAEKVELDKIEALYQTYRTTTDTASRRQIYHRIDSVSVVAAGYAIANEYDKMLSQIGAQGTNAYTFVEQTVYVNDIPSNQIQKWAEIEAERFSTVVPRLFHTELEAVYEEKNKGLDQDSRKVWETTFASLFLKDPYGTQTTIGTVEHLKNPSITEIKKYFNTYYVANNMALCMSGDLDYDSTIAMLENYFSALPNKPVPVFTPPVEDKIAAPIHKIVLGPSAESISIAYRLDVSIPQDPTFRSKLKMIQMLLTNGQAGLIDLNVNQAQKAIGAYAYDMSLKDYSMFLLGAKPITGQSLEDLEAILLRQINELKFGHFDDWLIKAVVNDYKMSTMLAYESNKNRADAFVDAFIWNIDWKSYLEEINTLEKMTKADIQEFCVTNFMQNYVVVYKKKGTDISIQKVPKPKISTVAVNRDSLSVFYKKVFSTPSPVLLPVFLDYSKEITQDMIKTLPVLYKTNKENTLFTQEYIWTLPRKYDPTYNLMVNYVNYLGSETYTPEALKEEFYKLGCSYSFKITANEFSISLTGLQENYFKAMTLLESFIKTIKPDDNALAMIKANALKTRNDNKSSKDIILRSALASYAKYDGVNPFTNILPESKINALTSGEVLKYLKAIYQKPHKIIYYGPTDLKTVKTVTGKIHPIPTSPEKSAADSSAHYTFKKPEQNVVYWVNYDMVQAEVLILTRSVTFDKTLIPNLYLYNEYFGGGMGSLLFQEMRESRALAYAVKSTFDIPFMPTDPYYSNSYIGTQADKIYESLTGMIDLIENMPESDLLFDNARISIIETLSSQRVTKLAVMADYLRNQRMGYTSDLRKVIYDSVSTMNYKDISNFQQKYVKGKVRSILIIGSKDKINFNSLSKYGIVKELTLEEIFGY